MFSGGEIMEWIGIILLSVALSLDAMGIGISCGVAEVRIPPAARIIIHLTSFLCTTIAVAAGGLLQGTFSQTMGRVAGGCLLCALGLYMLLKGVSSGNKRATRPGAEDGCMTSGKIGGTRAAVIGIVLSADSFAAGLSLGTMTMAAAAIPVLCALFQTVFLLLGEKGATWMQGLGEKFFAFFSAFSGTVLAGAGVMRLIF